MPVFRSGPLPAAASVAGLSASVTPPQASSEGNTQVRLSGQATPHAAIEVNNLSTLPTTGELVEAGMAIGHADAAGNFDVFVAGAVAGDVVQVQVRAPGGELTSAVQLRVDAGRSQVDPRAAMIRVDRLRVTLSPDGRLATLEPRTRQPITEPDAVVRYTNASSGVSVEVTADPLGRLPPAQLNVQPGDLIHVAVSDGSGNLDFSLLAGSLSLPTSTTTPPLPPPLPNDARSSILRPHNGPLIHPTGPRFGSQGALGNCPVPAACAALAAVDPAAIRDLIRPRADGHYTVTFHPPGGAPVEIVVDNQVWTSSWGDTRYGTGGRDPQTGAVESWFPLVEKAYAAWHGGYAAIGGGLSVGRVLAELTGRTVTELWTNQTSPDDLWHAARRAQGNRQALAAGTWQAGGACDYTGTGIYPNHAYSVLSLDERNGQRTVTLRNPWGKGTPVGGFPDGVFEMKWADFCRLFAVLNLC